MHICRSVVCIGYTTVHVCVFSVSVLMHPTFMLMGSVHFLMGMSALTQSEHINYSRQSQCQGQEHPEWTPVLMGTCTCIME